MTDTEKKTADKAAEADAAPAASDNGATDTSTPTTNLEIVAPSGGQIALTAHNNEDGTWSVTRGPGGIVLADGLPREVALGVVGAPTEAGYKPTSEQEERLIEMRKELENKSADAEVKAMFQSDADVEKNGNALVGDNAATRPARGRGTGAGAGGRGGNGAG